MKNVLKSSIERMVQENGIAYAMDRIHETFHRFNNTLTVEDYEEDLMVAARTAIRLEPMYAAACEYRVFKALGKI